MTSRASYHDHRELDPLSGIPINLTRRLPDEFRDWSMADLNEIEFEYLKCLAEARQAGDASSVDYLEHTIRKLDAERGRQQRVIRAEAARQNRPIPTLRHDGPQLAELAVQLKQQLNLIRFIEATGAATIEDRFGDRVKVRCPSPMHTDARPSCIVDSERFHCFSGSCRVDGDIFDLVGLRCGVTCFRDRVRIVTDYARQAIQS